MLALLVDGTDVFTGDTLFKGSVGGVRAPGYTTYDDLRHSIMDVLLALPPETTDPPGPHRPDDGRRGARDTTRSCASGAGWTPRATSGAPRWASPRRSCCWGDDYDGGHKAWVRWRTAPTTSSPGRGSSAADAALDRYSPDGKDRIPTSRIARSAKVGRLAAGQGARRSARA